MQLTDRWGRTALSRRAFVGKLAVGAAVASTVAAGTAAALTTAPASEAASGPLDETTAQAVGAIDQSAANVASTVPAAPQGAPWQLIAPLAAGSEIADGWRVAGMTDVIDGSCVVTLQNGRGRAHRVHLCRNDGSPNGLVYTDHLDLVVMNGGQGDLPTDEGLAQAVAALAHVLVTNEAHGAAAPALAAMLPHTQRVAQFAAAATLR